MICLHLGVFTLRLATSPANANERAMMTTATAELLWYVGFVAVPGSNLSESDNWAGS